MRLLSLSLENIGPFDRAELRFLDEPSDAVPVAFITGENGTGKSIVVDAIRGLFGPSYAKLERDITRAAAGPMIDASTVIDGESVTMRSHQFDTVERWFLPSEIRSRHSTIQKLFETSRFACPSWARGQPENQPAAPR